MKRLLSLTLAVIMVLSMSIPAFAGNGGSITITNATIGDTYALYKIFDASYSSTSDAVSYSIESTDQFFNYMFGTNGTAGNYFDYNATTGNVTRKENVTNQAIIDYLREMVQDKTRNWAPVKGPVTAESTSVVFDGLNHGYYLIDKGTAAAVTISSNESNVNVIDKTQKPGGEFNKQVWDEDLGQWVKDASASIGDVIDFKVEFKATNYDGEYPVKYYTIRDTKGSALWVEFGKDNDLDNVAEDTFYVKVGDQVLTQGYYHCANPSIQTNEWEYLGTWTEPLNPNNADWYLIHRGYDDFEIVIPWMTNHVFSGTTNGFELTYSGTPEPLFASPVNVEVKYSASVEPSAGLGSDQNQNLTNNAKLTWTANKTDGPDDPSGTTTTVYALGITKVDADTNKALQGAQFELYQKDKDGREVPVYVIPTDIKGVYILDDLNTDVTGENRETSRKKYERYLEAYLGENYATAQKNIVTSEANGKFAVLGLEKGTYYLREIQPPGGYNKLPRPVEIQVGSTNKDFFVIADANGNVIDKESAIEGYEKHMFTATTDVIKNSTGLLLPSTGGMGTTLLIGFGTLIAVVFAMFLITNKKMSVYED